MITRTGPEHFSTSLFRHFRLAHFHPPRSMGLHIKCFKKLIIGRKQAEYDGISKASTSQLRTRRVAGEGGSLRVINGRKPKNK